MAASQIGDLGDFIRSFPQFTYDDYLYRLSMAQVLFLTVDSTHIKYLRGKDKEIWESFGNDVKVIEVSCKRLSVVC